MTPPISFKELNWKLKVGIIGGWVVLIVYSISFMVGFVIGIIE